jgi:glycolate oxidase
MKISEVLPYEYDASGIKGKTKNVYFPKSIAELKSLVQRNKKICVRGGGSGLAGSAVPLEDAVIDVSKLNHIGNIDLNRKTIVLEAGVILDELQEFLSQYNLEFPVKPSSHAICTIGGMIATNAVGNRALKYGRTSKWVRWIEVVNAKGEIEKKGATEISDYAGMEGTTGIIARACLNLSIKNERSGLLIEMNTIDEIIEKTSELKKENDVCMIEFLDKKVSKGIGLKELYHLIVELENNKGELSGSSYESLLENRDQVYPFLAGKGYIIIEDPKLMLNKMPKFLNWLEENKIPYFGHISVGILHPCFKAGQEKLIEKMMKLVKRLGGQVSGEHGIGILKKEYVDEQDKKIFKNIKKRTDKSQKFNQGKII